MRIGIGIDTGGTYTDAVIYDFVKKNILHSAKALTTRQDLSQGIGDSLDRLPFEMLQRAEIISLSTTLATNACVEDKGGRAKLIFIGVSEKVVRENGINYGLPTVEDILFIQGGSDMRGEVKEEPNWEDFLRRSNDWIKDADAVAIVELWGMRNPQCELKARELIKENFGVKTLCGHELFSDLNSLKRGASALLNARLLSVIDEFMKAVKLSLERRNVNAPIVIVRSDGSLMSESFTTERPIETLLCGPAASVMGGIELTGEKNCLIIDMGGTTTDIALVKEGVPVKAQEGVKVGKWRTYVKAVYIDTFGLGGDSVIKVDNNGDMVLGPSRVVPLSIAADKWPEVKNKLAKLIDSEKISTQPLHEFLCLVRDITDSSSYNEEEKKLCKALKKGPLVLTDAAESMSRDTYTMKTERLEREGVILRCGLTPTDIMHIKGDFNEYNSEAAELGAQYVARSLHITVDELCERVYDKVKENLYINIVRMLLEEAYPDYRKKGIGAALEELVKEGWSMYKNKGAKGFIDLHFATPASLVGIGAPIHIFLPEVAKALRTKCVIPEKAGVANALGAVVGNITATHEVVIKPDYTISGISGYRVFGKHGGSYVEDKDEAISLAKEEAEKFALKEAIERGASGDIKVTLEVKTGSSQSRDKAEVLLEIRVVAKAVGRVTF